MEGGMKKKRRDFKEGRDEKRRAELAGNGMEKRG